MPNHVSHRYFIGGSDARIIMGDDEGALSVFGRKNEAKSNPKTCPAILSFSLVLRLKS